jgi:CDP-glycerol glycerophosphotransferase
MSILSARQARDKGYLEAFITYPALGDQLLLLYAARIRHETTGEKSLLGTSAPELFADLPFCDLLEGLSPLTADRMFAPLNRAGIELFPVTYYQPRKGADGQLFHGFPERHLLGEMCSRMGGSGLISLAPRFDLTEEEKHFGRFFKENQIAVMSRGKEKRKSWGVENMRALLAAFRGKYNFVQIGVPDDPLLEGALDKRGALPLRLVAAVLHHSDLFIGGIGALMHLARGVKCRSVITYSLSEPFHVDSYPCNTNIVADNGCTLCQDNLITGSDENSACVDNFSCIRNISLVKVCDAVNAAMSAADSSFQKIERTEIVANKAAPLNVLTVRLFVMAQSQKLTMKHTRDS